MKNYVAVHSNCFHGFAVEDALEQIALAGFQYVELSAVRAWTEHVMPDMGEERIDDLKCMMINLGLSCPILSGHCDLMQTERVQDFKRNIALARDLGCEYIVSSVGEAHYGQKEGRDAKTLAGNLRMLAPFLQAANLQMGIENHGEYGSGEKLMPLLDLAGVPGIGITYDTANAVYFGRRAPETDILCCSNRIRTVHLKDKRGPDYIGIYPALGQGNLKLRQIVETLLSNGYTGPFSVEIEFDADFALRNKTRDDLKTVGRALKDSRLFLQSVGLMP